MKNTEKIELFVKQFGEQPTDSKTDQFFLDLLDDLNNPKKREGSRKEHREYKAATIEVVVDYYSKSA